MNKIYDEMIKDDMVIELKVNDNTEMVLPVMETFIVEDESGLYSIKSTATRKTLAVVRK